MSGPQPDVPREDSDLWKLYANKIRETFFQGQDVGTKNRIWIPPLNSQSILAGDNINQAMTNSGVARTGDSLILPDNPMYTFGGETYSQKCLRYLQNVQLEGNSDLGLEQIASDRREAMQKKQADYQAQLKAALDAYNVDPLRDPSLSFAEWSPTNYPSLAMAAADRDGAANDYDQIMSQIYGPNYAALAKDIQKLRAVCNAESKSLYVMEVTPALFGSKDEPPKEGPKMYAPAYRIDPAYPTTVKSWIRKAADRNPPTTVLSFDTTETGKYDWTQVGHTVTKFEENSGWLPFFRVDYDYNGEKKSEVVHSNTSSTAMKFEFLAQGIQAFEIGPDNSWLPQDLKKNYPNLFRRSSPDLWDPMFRASRILVGYAVSIKITMDKSTYDSVKVSVSNASKQSSSSSAYFFGFCLDIGRKAEYSEENSTDWSNVKTDDNHYSFEIPASNNTIPVLLAVLGTEVAPANKGKPE